MGHPPEAFPLARQLAAEVLSLPMGPQLRPEDAMRVVDVLR
jgi:dTDP-4-amino-4,6-dideoxygalactose transaminase